VAEPVTVLLKASVSRGASLFVFWIHPVDAYFLKSSATYSRSEMVTGSRGNG
jgi:hypothetical protein